MSDAFFRQKSANNNTGHKKLDIKVIQYFLTYLSDHLSNSRIFYQNSDDTNNKTVIYENLKDHSASENLAQYNLSINTAELDRLSFKCSSGFFIWKKSTQQCVAPHFVCDNEWDCPYGEDEDNSGCSDNQILMYCVNVTDQHFMQKEELFYNTQQRYVENEDTQLYKKILSTNH